MSSKKNIVNSIIPVVIGLSIEYIFKNPKLINTYTWASQVMLVVKNPPAIAGDVRDTDSIPGLGRSPRGGCSNPLQYSCLKNPIDRGAWQTQSIGLQRVEHD